MKTARTLILVMLILLISNLAYAQVSGLHNVVSFQKVLTNNSATGIFSVALPSGGMIGGVILYNIFATGGGEFQSHAGYAAFAAVNKGGVYTTNIAHISNAAGGEAGAVSAGTIADAWTITTGSNLITVNLNANSSLGVNPVLHYTTFLFNPGTITLL